MSSTTPSPRLIAQLDAELARYAPFDRMAAEHRRAFVEASEQVYFAPDEVVLEPSSGVPQHMYVVRSGCIVGERGYGGTPFVVEAGEMMSLGAALGERAVTGRYRAREDTFCLAIPVERLRELARESPPLLEFLQSRVLKMLELSKHAMVERFAALALAEQSLETPLAAFTRREPLSVPPGTALGDALGAMHERNVGSVLVTDPRGAAIGILTRHDVLERVVLAGRSLDSPIDDAMSKPVHTLTVHARAHDAALLMSRERVRHVPIVDSAETGRVVGVVSERDLFVLQRRSLVQIGGSIDGATSVHALEAAAEEIRRFARQLLAQGVAARALTELVSHLNDRLTVRLVTLLAAEHALDLQQACWVAFGSEGRGEQTIATDQDNGLVLSPEALPERARWLSFGDAVNHALATAGYPLCRGGVMAGQEACCLGADEWQARFVRWIDQGAPEHLLAASIYFDLRPVVGNAALVGPLTDVIAVQAAASPRFLKLMADNLLSQRPPLAWHGGISGDEIDLKLQGTAIFVGGARLLALAAGVRATGTSTRLQLAGKALGIAPEDTEGWISAFEYLQTLRLAAQVGAGVDAPANRIAVAKLNVIDRRVLREALQAARRLQQRIELDYP
ncbi:MAG: CBS domain-containing protein [Burkholderiales bacterium]|nr:CBS domain-containing protein [Burkholderiales bacterium]